MFRGIPVGEARRLRPEDAHYPDGVAGIDAVAGERHIHFVSGDDAEDWEGSNVLRHQFTEERALKMGRGER